MPNDIPTEMPVSKDLEREIGIQISFLFTDIKHYTVQKNIITWAYEFGT